MNMSVMITEFISDLLNRTGEIRIGRSMGRTLKENGQKQGAFLAAMKVTSFWTEDRNLFSLVNAQKWLIFCNTTFYV
jgi:hypothetical protein